MKAKHTLIILLFVAFSRIGSAQADTSHYMYSYLGVNGGYDVNMSGAKSNYINPFWATNGYNFYGSALFALKESYFGIICMAGYMHASFDLTNYLSDGIDSNRLYKYTEVEQGTYNLYYAMAGLNIKIPGRTTREAIELRFLIGPIHITQTAIQYSYSPNASPNNVTQVTLAPASTTTIGFCPGIGAGYKIDRHFAIMANADLFFTNFLINTNMESENGGNAVNQNLAFHSAVVDLQLTAGIIYTIGHITGNIAY
jgi:hypothetical protein